MAKIPKLKSELRRKLEILSESSGTKEDTLRFLVEEILPEVAELELSVSEAKAETQKAQEIYVRISEGVEKREFLQGEIKVAQGNLEETLLQHQKSLVQSKSEILEEFDKGLDAAQAAFFEKQAITKPVELWTQKQSEHTVSKWINFALFMFGVLLTTALVAALVYFLATEIVLVEQLLAPFGCDPENQVNCDGISLRGALIATGTLTILTLLLWFARLQMKLFLAERHLALDARERKAFAESYLGLVREGDVSEEAREQRALVYAALFRPSSDGTVREEGGLDPSVAAALSKFLMRG
ncbi:DUF6161 domain-containing protein [Phaeobacter sp. 11ANDIMAR09]|uniref:DUF6161 domain-containing protein n=1 Tax=Phaeobacter sp. 11ANDIMAR09 TaxID=1225647 RepID=UPI0006C89709|nr:DUF6161 domain-containing protein [Phaeobacter sp. 11ANDIMAR09]